MDSITPTTKDSTSLSPNTAVPPAKRGRGRPKKSVSLDKEKKIVGDSEKTPETARPRTSRKRKSACATNWTLEDKQKFNAGLTKGGSFKKKTDGTINWQVLTKYIGTKSLKEVKEFAKYYNSLENGKTYEEFSSKAAVDVWRDLADKLVMPGDNIANVCIPQVLTVAALEPIQNIENVISHPNYSNIYNYLSSVTRGTEAPELPANDAAVVLELLEDLIKWLSKSQTLVQREFMHTRYADLRKHLTSTRDETADTQYNTSTNPFAIPFDILEFKVDHLANEP